MGIEVRIIANDATELASLVDDLRAKLNADAPAIEATEERPTRSRRGKNSASAATGQGSDEGSGTENGTMSGSPGQTATTDASPSDGDVVYADVQKAVTQLAAAKGRDAVLAVFKQFGVDHGVKLTTEQWAPALAALQAAKDA